MNKAHFRRCLFFWLMMNEPFAVAQSPAPDWMRNYPELMELHRKYQQQTKALADRDREMLNRVIGGFRKIPDPSNQWQPLLQRMNLELPLTDVFDRKTLRASAYAPNPASGQRVTINQMMTWGVQSQADVAARRMSTRLRGMPANYPEDEVLAAEAMNIYWHALAWIVAHEIAHHRLGHTGRRPASLEQSRAWELDADALAFDMINKAGFSVYLVAWYFEAMRAQEDLTRRYGLDRTAEESSSHPLWRLRLERLNTFLRTAEAPDEGWIVLSWLETFTDGQPLVKRTFLLPRDPSAHAMAVVTVISRGARQEPQIVPGLAGVEQAQNSAATIYMRTKHERVSCVFRNRFAASGRAECQTTVGQSSRPHTITFYRDSFAGLFAADSSRPTQALLNLGLGIKEMQRGVIAELVSNQALRQNIFEFLDVHTRIFQLNILGYHKGEFSEDEYNKNNSDSITRYPRYMRQALGETGFIEFEKRLAARMAADLRRAQGQ